MYSKTPDDWHGTLPLVLEACSVPNFEKNLLDTISKQLSSIKNANEYLQLCNEYFLCSVYYACIKLFHAENQKEMGLDDVENMFFKIFNTHLSHAKLIFLDIPQKEFSEYLEKIEFQMNEALESDDENICNIASSIKSIIPIFQYYHQYQLALYALESKFGEVENLDDYISIIREHLSKTDTELTETVELYRSCVNSRIFLKRQSELEELFAPIFDNILGEENIGPQTNLELYSPHDLQDIKTIITFKQAMYGNDRHGYFVHLGLFIKYALDLLTKEHPNTYYFNLFISNMAQDEEFGDESPILISLRKLKIVAETLEKLSQLSCFTLVLPFLNNPNFSYAEVARIISYAPFL